MKNHIAAFSSPAPSASDSLSQIGDKARQLQKRTAGEIKSARAVDEKVKQALLDWRGKNPHQHFKIPEGTDFTSEELDLAGLIHTYADMYKMPFNKAINDIFDWLKRNPRVMQRYTGGDESFAESTGGSVNFSVPSGYSVDGATMEVFRRARIYQAGHPGCEFIYAVQISKLR